MSVCWSKKRIQYETAFDSALALRRPRGRRARPEAAGLTLYGEAWDPVICHHDMVPENIIVNDRGLFIIDWEYAALGHPGLDFLRLYGSDYASPESQKESLQSLFKVKQAMDKLWLAVQL